MKTECTDCGNELKFFHCNDNPSMGYAQNLYECVNSDCCNIYVERVWGNEGITLIRLDGSVETYCEDG